MKTRLILLLALSGALCAAEAPKPLKPVLQSFVDQNIAPGVVALVANKDGVLALDTAGYASLAKKSPMREDTVFWIASMSKSLTGAALMMLVDEGKVSLDDPVEKYLPEFKGQQVKETDGTLHPPKHPITVREIMSHTSGMVLASDKGLKSTQVLKDDVVEYQASAAAGARHEIRIQQLRHQHRRSHHRSRQRHELRRLHAEASL